MTKKKQQRPLSSEDTVSDLPRTQKERLLEKLLTREQVRQATQLDGYNNAAGSFLKREARKRGVKPEDLVHHIQVDFHKDPAPIRFFIGGNRCLAEGTLVSAPNGRKLRIENIRAGDTVLAVDPDTRKTMPVPVSEVFYQGEQAVYQWESRGFDGKTSRTLESTANHEILTTRGLEQASSIEEGSIAIQPTDLYYAGLNPKEAAVIGYLYPLLRVDDGKPTARVNSKVRKLVKGLIWKLGIDGYVRPNKLGVTLIFGGLRKQLLQVARQRGNFLQDCQYRYSLDGIKALLGGLLTHKLMQITSVPTFACKGIQEGRFIHGSLKALGLSPTVPERFGPDGYCKVRLGSPVDVVSLCNQVKLPLIKGKLMNWAQPRLDRTNKKGPQFLKQPSYWRLHTKLGHDEPETKKTYDIKLAGGHNLFVANGFVVGNSGKTEAGAVELIWLLTGTHPYRKNIPIPNVGRVLAESLEHFELDILPKIKRWAPGFRHWKPIKGHQGRISGFKLPNGSSFHVFTHQQDPAKLEGTNFYFLWANEPPPESHVNASRRGLIDQAGITFFTLTPLSEPYLYNDYVLPARIGNLPTVGLHECSIWKNPWLDPIAVEQFLSTLDPDERQAREDGTFRHLQGRVFKSFDPLVHVIQDGDVPQAWPVCVGIDPHLRKDHVAVFVCMSRKGWYVAVDEISCTGDIEEFGQRIIDLARLRKYNIQSIAADSFLSQPDMLRRDIEPRTVLNEMLWEAGLPSIQIAKKKDTVAPFIAQMKTLLKEKEWPQWGKKTGPSFYVMARCQGLIKDFQSYVYRENKRPEIMGVGEAPSKLWDDFLDACKYALLADPTFAFNMRQPEKLPSLESYGGGRR